MTPKKAAPFALSMFIVVCTLSAVVVPPPSAIAQEDDDEAENLASDTVSNVLDNGNTTRDNTNTNTQLSVPLTDQDQTDANLGLSEALDVIVERTLSSPTTTPPPDDDGELPPPEFVAFCLEITNQPEEEVISDILCFDTSEECAEAQEVLEDRGFVISMECEGVETFPPGALECVVFRDNPGGVVSINCQMRPNNSQ